MFATLYYGSYILRATVYRACNIFVPQNNRHLSSVDHVPALLCYSYGPTQMLNPVVHILTESFGPKAGPTVRKRQSPRNES
jgi:hypothetical protein